MVNSVLSRVMNGRLEWLSGWVPPSACLMLALAGFSGTARAAEAEGPVLRVSRVETLGSAATAAGDASKAPGDQITLDVTEKPLRQVLEYLSTASGKNIRTKKDKDGKLLVSFKLENVTYSAILDFIAKKYGMSIDDSMAAQNIILLDTLEKVSMIFNNADIRDVITTISIQAGANIVIDDQVKGTVSMRLDSVPWRDALGIVVRTADFVAIDEAHSTIRITTPSKVAAQQMIRLFRLAYISPEGSKYTAVLTSDIVERKTGDTTLNSTVTGGGNIGQSLLDVLTKIKSPQGSISYEKRTNTVIIKDIQTSLDDVQQIISKLDIPPKQIHISVKLVELTDNDLERLGVDWSSGVRFNVSPVSNWLSAFPFDVSNGLSKSLLGDLVTVPGSKRAIGPLGAPITTSDFFNLRRGLNSQGAGLSLSDGGVVNVTGGTTTSTEAQVMTLGSMGFGTTTALLEMIKTRTRGRVIQSPQIVALDNEEASIQVGQLVRYAETVVSNTEGGGNVGGFREASGSPLRLGFQLLVIPHVTGPENNVLMTIIPKTETLLNFETFGDLRLPQTNQSIVVTKMMLRNGETGVIGGMKEESEDLQERKVPIFGDIPFIGRLFKHRSKSTRGRNLLVFVTPTIIDFYSTDDFKKGLEKVREDYQKPFTSVGEETASK